jgi:hypothetical protein
MHVGFRWESQKERLRRRWEDSIKMDLREIEWRDMHSNHMAQDVDQWWELVNTVMNLRVPQNVSNS